MLWKRDVRAFLFACKQQVTAEEKREKVELLQMIDRLSSLYDADVTNWQLQVAGIQDTSCSASVPGMTPSALRTGVSVEGADSYSVNRTTTHCPLHCRKGRFFPFCHIFYKRQHMKNHCYKRASCGPPFTRSGSRSRRR